MRGTSRLALYVTALLLAGIVAFSCVRVKREYVYITPDGAQYSSSTDEQTAITVTGLQSPAGQEDGALRGDWTGRGDWDALDVPRPGRSVVLWMVSGSSSQVIRQCHSISGTELVALPTTRGTGPESEPLRFALQRPAGKLVFEGQANGHKASGTVRFEPDKDYVAQVKDLTGTELTPRRTLDLLFSGLEVGYIRAIKEAGYEKVSLDDIERLHRAGVTADYAKAMRQAGYDFSPAQLADLHRYGVRAEYATQLRAAGYRFSAEQVMELNRYGVRAEYARQLRDAGYELGSNEILELNRYGVRPDYAKGLTDAGYKLSVQQILELNRYGIRTDYAKGLRDAGYSFGVQELIELNRYGIRADYAKSFRDAGYTLSVHDLIELSRYGIRPDYAAMLHVEGKQNLSVQEIIDLSRKGIDAQTIRKLRGS